MTVPLGASRIRGFAPEPLTAPHPCTPRRSFPISQSCGAQRASEHDPRFLLPESWACSWPSPPRHRPAADSVHVNGLRNIATAGAAARARAWDAGVAPTEIVIDLDDTLLDAHPDKQNATATYPSSWDDAMGKTMSAGRGSFPGP